MFSGLTPSCSWAVHRELTCIQLQKSGVLGRSHNFWQVLYKLKPSNLFTMVSISVVERQSKRKHRLNSDLENRNCWALLPTLMSTTSTVWVLVSVFQRLISFLNALKVKMCQINMADWSQQKKKETWIGKGCWRTVIDNRLLNVGSFLLRNNKKKIPLKDILPYVSRRRGRIRLKNDQKLIEYCDS